MKVCYLSSGSVGNALIIEDDTSSLLLDCGISYKRFKELIINTSLDETKIKHLLITHEHSDHIKGVGVIARKLNLKLWGSRATLDCLYEKGILKTTETNIDFCDKYVETMIDDFKITAFPLSHDAIDPIGYVIEKKGLKLVILTDTGYVSKRVRDLVSDADVYFLELNHNVEMLHMSNRPWHLKQRILSDYGHLSNEDGAYIFSKVATSRTKHVFLSHISQEANLPELALMTFKNVMIEEKFNIADLNIHLTHPLKPSAVIEL